MCGRADLAAHTVERRPVWGGDVEVAHDQRQAGVDLIGDVAGREVAREEVADVVVPGGEVLQRGQDLRGGDRCSRGVPLHYVVGCWSGYGWWVWPETRQVLRGWGAHGPSALSIPATPTAPPCGPVETGSKTTDGGFREVPGA